MRYRRATGTLRLVLGEVENPDWRGGRFIKKK